LILPTSLIIAASVVKQGRTELISDWNLCGSKGSLQPLDIGAVICKKISGLKMHIILGINYESTQWIILYLDASAKAMFDALSLHLEKKVTISCLQLYSTMVSIGTAGTNKNNRILSKSDFFCHNKCCS